MDLWLEYNYWDLRWNLPGFGGPFLKLGENRDGVRKLSVENPLHHPP